MIREAEKKDLWALLNLYTKLNDNQMPDINERIEAIWEEILTDKNHHIIIGEIDHKLISSCVMIIVPNLTQKQRPYALIENVITDDDYRKRGYGTAILNYAKDIAVRENCYKLMLLTGSKDPATLNFYEQSGYNRQDKTGFVQWLI
ncbi:MAG: GNAT family N-acetyltransferase [Bacillota bacterium]